MRREVEVEVEGAAWAADECRARVEGQARAAPIPSAWQALALSPLARILAARMA